MTIAIVGGTGTAGSEAVRALRARRHVVRVLSRNSPDFPVDLKDASGLVAALDGVDAVVNAVQGDREVMVGGTQRLLAAEARAGVAHHVELSIVGIEHVPIRYYRLKLEQEAVVREGAVPWTILRATQFHTLIAGLLKATARFGVLPSASARLAPVDPREVGAALADAVEAVPAGATTEFAGPEVLTLAELALHWRRATRSRALPLPIPLAGRAGRALKAGALTSLGARRGHVGFTEWLQRDSAPEPVAAWTI